MAQLNDLVVNGPARVVGDEDVTGDLIVDGTVKGNVMVIPVNPNPKPTENGAIWIETT